MTRLAVHSYVILVLWTLSKCCCVADLEATREGHGRPDIDAAAAAAATATARRLTAATKVAEDDVRGAALHCVALDEAGEFTTNRVLGIFEVAPLQLDPPPVGKVGISKAEVEFVVRRRHEDDELHDSGGGGGGGISGSSDSGPGMIAVNVFLEVALGGGVSVSSSPGKNEIENAAGTGNASEIGDGISGRAPSSAERGREGGGGEGGGEGFGLSFGVSDGYHVPTRGDVEAAAAAATVAVTDPAGAQAAISALACWNLVMTSWEAGVPAVHVEVAVAFGNRGGWYTVNKTIALTKSALPGTSSDPGASPPSPSSESMPGAGSGNHGTALLSASFDWQPTADIWAMVGGPIVADVKVYAASDADVTGGASIAGLSSSPPVQPMLQATLCKRAAAGGAGEGGTGRETTAVRTYVTPYSEQPVTARRTAHGSSSNSGISSGDGSVSISSSSSSTGSCNGVQTQPSLASVVRDESSAGIGFITSSPWVVSEIDDREWWTNHDREEWGKGMHAVHALPRLRGWKPGDWRKRQQRRKKQAYEKERRRAGEAASRRESARAKRGDGSRPTVSGSRNSVWGVVKGAWKAAGREWRRARRNFGRRVKK